MHKKLEAELVSLAHSILQMKNKDDVHALHKKAHAIYEKLSVLKFVDDYIQTTPHATETKEEILEKLEEIIVESDASAKVELHEPLLEIESEETTQDRIDDAKKEAVIDEPVEIINEEISAVTSGAEESEDLEEIIELVDDPSEEIELEVTSTHDEPVNQDTNDEITAEESSEEEVPIQMDLSEEFKDAISADQATNLFEKATKEHPVIEEPQVSKQKSLNDALFADNIQVGLNDRIAFVKHLFEGSQEDFNRVLSQLNSFKSEEEAKKFISGIVKPDYDWSDKEEYEDRLISLIERKFL